MFIKFYSKISKYIKKNWYLILIPIIFAIVLNIKIPYKVESKGDMFDLNEKIIVDNQYDSKGTYNITSVTVYDGSVASYIMTLFDKSMDLVRNDEYISNNETESDMKLRNKMMLENSLSNATYVAYKAANKDLNSINCKIKVAYVDNQALTNLKVGDDINYINNLKIKDLNDIKKIINNSEIGDKLIINKDKYAYVNEIDNRKSLYLYLINNCEFDHIKFKFNKDESGPSGGLMIALSIYDKITSIDLTNGRVISGTGTIDLNGNVGEISGINYKILGALKSDIFFLPYDNYDEAYRFVKDNNYNLNLVPVRTFNDALEYLKK